MADAMISFLDIRQSQLDYIAPVPGRILVCTDTGNLYHDRTSNNRIQIGTDIQIVDELPLAPLTDRLYLLKPHSLYMWINKTWVELNPYDNINTQILGLKGEISEIRGLINDLDENFETRVDTRIDDKVTLASDSDIDTLFTT